MLSELGHKVLIFDGGFGSELVRLNLTSEHSPEDYNITNPTAITSIHKNYVESGADFVTTNTFGLNRYKYKGKYDIKSLAEAAIKNARLANPKYVAFDIGPLGKFLSPLGTLSFDEAYEAFKEVVLASKECDCYILETFSDIYELKAAILAVKENSNKKVLATMTFDSNHRTLTGTTPEVMVRILEGLGVDALGINCSLGPKEISPIAKEILSLASIPVLIQPNRGIPSLRKGVTCYDVKASEFFSYSKEFVDLGASVIGGCCGTTPEFIKELSKLKGKEVILTNKFKACLTSGTELIDFNGFRVIGERLNPTGKKKLKEAIINQDYDYMVKMAIDEVEHGADILDLNMGLPKIDEEHLMVNAIKKISEVVTKPIAIDSTNPKVLEKALRYYNGIALVNSVNGDLESLNSILPIVKKYGAMVIGLTLDSNGVPNDAAKRFEIANRIILACKSQGIDEGRIVIDPLTLTASATQAYVYETIKAVKMLNNINIKTSLGVSNVSFGLPNRVLLNKTFLVLALENGLDMAIINPNEVEMKNAILAFNVLKGFDIDSKEYILKSVSVEALDKSIQTTEATSDIESAIRNGINSSIDSILLEKLKTLSPMDIINSDLIPILGRIGDDFEKGKIFLPQLLHSSEAAKYAFDKVSAKITSALSKKGPIILATVKGDVHDIGKNICKVILESYGYKVIDLGKDVNTSVIIDAYKTYKPMAIGLSALMTTTVVNMEDSIKELKLIDGMCPIFVGGAVMTSDLAKSINADYYTKDALSFYKKLEEVLYGKNS